MMGAAAGAGRLAAELAYLAAADRTCPALRLWSASFAMDAARSLALVGHPGHGSLADIAAEILSVGHVGMLTSGILIWAETTPPLRIGPAGAAAAALWAGAGPVGGLTESVVHLPLDLYFVGVLGVAAWTLWTHAAAEERLVRRATAVVAAAWLLQELASATIGWHGESNPLGFRSEEHTSELQSLMRSSYAVFCLKKKKTRKQTTHQKE